MTDLKVKPISIEALSKLTQWSKAVMLVTEAKLLVEAEQTLRKEVMNLFFPEPQEGVNSFNLPEGWILKGTHKIDRKIDEAALPAIMSRLREMKINADVLIKRPPQVVTPAYRELVKLNPEAAKVFEESLIIKPESPSLALIPPKTS